MQISISRMHLKMQLISRIGCAAIIREILCKQSDQGRARRSFTTICEILGRAKRIASSYYPHGNSFNS